MTKKLIFLALFLTIFINGLAQTGSITGKILHRQNPIEKVTVQLKNTDLGTTTNVQGEFLLDNLIPGKYDITISCVGFKPLSIEVTVSTANQNLGTINLEEDFLLLDQVVVTATREEILRTKAPIITQVFDDKIFRTTQSVTLSEGLSFQPALRIENNCQNCGFNGLRMNGLEGAYSQILIDGRPIFNSLQGVYGLEQIPANMIERVEVVRSGGSTLYGSSAIAGTVNIITKEPTENSTHLSTNQAFINGNSADRAYMVGTNVINTEGTAGVSLNGFNRTRAHWDSNGDAISEIGDLKATSLAIKAFYKPTELSKITFNGYNIYEFRRGGNNFNRPLHEADIAESTTHNILNGGLTYEQYTKDYNHKFSLYGNAQSLKRDSYYGSGQDVNAYGNSTGNNAIAGFQYTGKLGPFLGGTHTLVSGMEYNYDNLEDSAPSYGRFIDQTAEQLGFYIQDMWEIGEKVNMLLGTRIDDHNLVDDVIISPRANLLYKISSNLQFRVGYARGFRAPQVFDEDLHITQVGGEGTIVTNADNLNPEYSNAFSTSLDYNRFIGPWTLGITLDGFHTELRDVFILEEVGNEADGTLLLERRNGTGATVTGVTVNPKIQFKDKASLQLGLTLQKSEYETPVQWSETVENTSKRFFRTPDTYGFYVATWNIDKNWGINLSGVYTGSMIAQHYAGDIPEDVLEPTPSFWENNFKIDYSFTVNDTVQMVLSGGIQNYTNAYQDDFDRGPDRDSAYIYGPARPRTFFMGMNINL